MASYPPDLAVEGLTLEEVGDDMGCEPAEAALRLYEQSEGSYVQHTMEDEDVYVIAANPHIAVASDGNSLRDEGPLASGKPHPPQLRDKLAVHRTHGVRKGPGVNRGGGEENDRPPSSASSGSNAAGASPRDSSPMSSCSTLPTSGKTTPSPTRTVIPPAWTTYS